MTISKAEACEILHISPTTLWRRCKAGVYKFEKAAGQFGELTFTLEGLGLEDSRPLPSIEQPVLPSPLSRERGADSAQAVRVQNTQTIPDLSEPDAFDPHEFRDSFGHRIAGNEKHILFDNQPPPRPMATDEHMPEGLRNVVTGGDAGSDSHPINQMMIRARLMKPEERPQTETQRRQFVDRAAWAAGMAKGFSR
jgi:hypothetical protein